MQREILFRIWVKSIKAYLKNYDNADEVGVRYVGVLNSLCRNPQLETNDCIFQQFTGLTDKNGKKIFEGDVLIFRPAYNESLGGQFGNAIFSVSFEGGSFRFGKEIADQESANYYEVIGNIFEVIGNIFENRELIHE